MRRFCSAVVFNTLLAGTDAHARNYSLQLRAGQVRLAPLYDLVSCLPWAPELGEIELAMPVGSQFRRSAIRRADWEDLAVLARVPRQWLLE
ncbi:MAG: HipA domain-containing protein [Candidatus Nanopelagicales bacterium]